MPTRILAIPQYAAESSPLKDAFGRPVDEPFVLISITSPGEPDANIKPNPLCKDILRTKFYDIDKPLEHRHPMSPDLAGPIVEFGQKHRDLLIVVHCAMGACRSPAVAAALCKILGRDDSRYFRQYRPNAHVYRTILTHHFERPTVA